MIWIVGDFGYRGDCSLSRCRREAREKWVGGHAFMVIRRYPLDDFILVASPDHPGKGAANRACAGSRPLSITGQQACRSHSVTPCPPWISWPAAAVTEEPARVRASTLRSCCLSDLRASLAETSSSCQLQVHWGPVSQSSANACLSWSKGPRTWR